ncbi:hypothetical protein IE53DRAFT_131001 [Violaceomyces palustris]|uniref:Uncharacterized protein n=1 Tax=Violaceomyces palustris TaxID=1673888 RepID=A0ACD0NV63_9BASI|nr:hypothetical protein IE53DRAFT_131001 [Violaceomyces palustris]
MPTICKDAGSSDTTVSSQPSKNEETLKASSASQPSSIRLSYASTLPEGAGNTKADLPRKSGSPLSLDEQLQAYREGRKLSEDSRAGPSSAAECHKDSSGSSEQDEIARLKRELASKNEIISSQCSTISLIKSQCTCNICLELVWRPFILSPCGHIFCVRCLLSWFKKPSPSDDPLPARLSAAERESEERKRILRKKKVCPACRAHVEFKPVEVWLVKGMLEKISESFSLLDPGSPGLDLNKVGEEELRKAKAEDLPPGQEVWEGIFDDHGPRRVIIDHEDGVRRCGRCASEIWDGHCSNLECGLEYTASERGSQDSDNEDDGGRFPYQFGTTGYLGNLLHGDGSEIFSGEEEDDGSDLDSFIEDDMEEDDGFLPGPRRIHHEEDFGDGGVIVVSDSEGSMGEGTEESDIDTVGGSSLPGRRSMHRGSSGRNQPAARSRGQNGVFTDFSAHSDRDSGGDQSDEDAHGGVGGDISHSQGQSSVMDDVEGSCSSEDDIRAIPYRLGRGHRNRGMIQDDEEDEDDEDEHEDDEMNGEDFDSDKDHSDDAAHQEGDGQSLDATEEADDYDEDESDE